ncbi:MAG: pentapeptide repeat-containing protein, partial [Cyanobacteriota bacterium]|nr:pentapeptide repeat-containing protein [Cyanobacteriota bacterium]
MPFSGGLVLLFLLLLTELTILTMVKRQGIQKALANIFGFLAIVVPLLAVLGSIGGDNNEFINKFRTFRTSSFINAFSNSEQSNVTVLAMVYFLVGVAGILILTAALTLAVVIVAAVTTPKLAFLPTLTPIIGGGITCGILAYNGTDYLPKYVPHIVYIIAAIFIAISLALLAYPIAKRTLAGDEKHAILHQIAVFIAAIGGTSFRNANLTDANFTKATLKSADLRKANTTKTLWRQAKHLELARTSDTILINPKVRDLLITGDGYQKSYTGANLRGANLIGANLSYADLKAADISEATLQAACLDWANLTEIQAIGTDFTYAQMTGCSLENWNIDTTTKLNEVESRFVYLLEHPKPNTDDRERRPSSGEFSDGEFTKLFEEVLNTVDLIFRNGIDWQAFMSSFKQVQVENEDTELNIQSIENKGEGVVVVKVSVPEETKKEKIHSDFVQIYDDTVRKLEEKYQAELEGKEGEIAIYRRQNENMMSFLNNIVPSRLSTPPNKIKREKLVVIGFSNGDLERGFATVRAQIWSDGNPLPVTFSAKLPPETKIAQLYQEWHHQYEVLSGHYQFRSLMPRIKNKNNEPTNFSEIDLVQTKQDFEGLAQTLAASLNHWLNSPDFIRIQNQLRMQLNPSNRVRLVIETEDIKMRRLPWHCWDFFQDYRLAEVALSNPEGKRVEKLIPPREKIRILAILGSDEGINVEVDRQFLESLPDAEIVFLVKP